ncbi:Ig-like domain-containing protein [Kitasatospora griseola]|uniref:Ig-like domain-containing protein n=1 Tax=Kitasatospora griseola TaxID=2064 RepID=UPI0037F2B400
MCRQFLHRAPAPDARPADRDRPGPRIGRTTTALIATGLLTGLGTPPVAAQQTPGSWSAGRRAQLPSGLAVQFDWTAAPGTSVEAAPGRLAERTGSAYSDGIRPGDPAETFRAAEDQPRADGSWRALGTLRLSFSSPVRNPRLHLSGLTGLSTGKGGATGSSTRLTVAGGSPAAPALVGRAGWAGWTVGPGELAPAADGARDGDADGAGTLELAGTVSTVDLRVEQRSTARDGSTTPPAALGRTWTVTVDEGLGSAPESYGNASHLLSDLFLGQDATPAATRSRPGLAQSVEKPVLSVPPAAATGPLAPGAETDPGADRRSPWANPAPPRLRPGRADYRGADPSLTLPTETVAGRTYRAEVPVGPGAGPAVLAGWIDFDHNGRFDPAERVQTDVPAGASSAQLEWKVPAGAASGDTWVRLRLARDASQLAAPDGFADSGQVVDQRIALTVGPTAPGPEIALPIPGTVTGETRPEFRGDGAVAGSGIAVQENGTALCLAQVGEDGSWNCRPDNALGESTHTLVLAETTREVVLRGEPFRLTVKTTAPTAPVLTLPAYSNDPGLLVTGLGEPGSTVTASADGGPEELDLCSTGVAADGSWSCLPVENLADGVHRLTPHARDGAGNTSDGKPVELRVDTVAPDKPQLLSPTAGELLHSVRPVITGRAEPGSTVTVTAGQGGRDRVTVCSAVAAADGSWSCTATHDLAGGDVTLIATATDPAGNGTAGDPVPVRVPGSSAGSGSGSGSTAPAPTASPSAPTPSTTVPTPSGAPSATASPTAPPSRSPVATSPSASASASPTSTPPAPPELLPVVVPVGTTPAPTAGAGPAASGSASASVPASGAPSAPEPGPGVEPAPPFLKPTLTSDQSPFAARPAEPDAPDAAGAASGSPSPTAAPSTGAPSPSPVPSAPASPTATPSAPASPTATPSAPASPTATPSARPSAVRSDAPSGRAVAAAEPTGSSADEAARGRTLAPPPGGVAAAERRAAATGWRGLACGALLIAAGFGLLARRVFGRRRRSARRR